jgi:hypothetical protein
MSHDDRSQRGGINKQMGTGRVGLGIESVIPAAAYAADEPPPTEFGSGSLVLNLL